MPIAYACPHCGKQFSVADQYAGQTGPCAACGKPITIPGPSSVAYAPKPSSGGGTALIVVLAVFGVLMLFSCPGVLIALLLPAIQAARQAAPRPRSMDTMRQLSLAMMNYHDTHRSYPPAVVTDANGKPLYSGRVLLLPFLEQSNLYNAFNKDEPWDSPTNRNLSGQMLA